MARQTIDIVYGERVIKGLEAEVEGSALWLSPEAMEGATGWHLRAEGFCKGERCVAVPEARREELAAGGRYSLTALAELIGQPIVRDDAHRVWCFGEAAAERKRALTSLLAPDFELPDLSGERHRLSAYRGKKVFLVSWASW